MGIFGRMKRAAKAKANAAIDKRVDPAREIEMAILDIEAQQKTALKELVSYKATAKAMEGDIASAEEKVKAWEKRAMVAVRKGDDALARECLREQKSCAGELERLRRDQNEALGYAAELNRSRKAFATRLELLKLKKGTMATQIAAARSGTGNPLGISTSAFDRMDRAEEKIESDAIAAEVAAGMETEKVGAPSSVASEAAFDAALRAAGADPGAAGDDALAALKSKMAAEREQKRQTNGTPSGTKQQKKGPS